jgi:hypothetical protein
MSDETQFDAWHYRDPELLAEECIRVNINGIDGVIVDLDIRDAVYFRYLLDGAINDYERAVGR